MDRASASAGERAAAEWGAQRLAAAGATAVTTQSFRYSPGWGLAQVVQMLAAATGRLPALAALAALELDFSGRAQPLRRVLPRGEGANVLARVPAREAADSTVVLVAHHDAAKTGLLWSSPFADSGAKRGRAPADDAADRAGDGRDGARAAAAAAAGPGDAGAGRRRCAWRSTAAPPCRAQATTPRAWRR